MFARPIKIIHILLTAFVIRMVVLMLYGINKISFGDAWDYLNAAKYIIDNFSYSDTSNLPFFRAPLLPIYICIVTFGNPDNIFLIKLSFILLDCINVFLIFHLSLTLFDNEKTSLLSAAISAIYPIFIFQILDIRTEPLCMFFIITAILFFLKNFINPKILYLSISGVCSALASLTRPSAFVLIPYISLIYVIEFWAKRPKRFLYPLIYFFFSFMIFSPWIIRNHLKYHEFILINDALGYNFWRGSTIYMYNLTKTRDPDEFKKASINFENNITKKYQNIINKKAHTPHERSKEWFKLAINEIKNNKKIYLYFTLYKAITFWRPWLNPKVYGLKKAIFSLFIIFPVYILALIELASYRKKDSKIFKFIIYYLIIVWLVHIPFQVVLRFRIPFIEPIMVIFASKKLYKYMPATGIKKL